MPKEKSIEEQIKEETAMLVRSFASWEHIRTHGCSDPFYSDGCNMNLERNHIIYSKNRLEELCKEIPLPSQYYIPTPEEVNEKYMAANGEHYNYRMKNLSYSCPDITTKTPHRISSQQELF
jgi:hypothetical protein